MEVCIKLRIFGLIHSLLHCYLWNLPYLNFYILVSWTSHCSMCIFPDDVHLWLKHAVFRMPSAGMLSRVSLVRTNVSEELSASIIGVTRISELGTTLAMKNGVFWVVTPCDSCKNRRFGGTWRLLHQGDKIGELGTTQAATSNRRMLQRNTLRISSQRTSVASCSLCCS
jgi:hypothetical protein